MNYKTLKIWILVIVTFFALPFATVSASDLPIVDGIDSYWGEEGVDPYYGDSGYDSWYSDSGYDSYYSDSGYDSYYSDSGYDSWFSDSGYDSYYSDSGYDPYYSDSGFDSWYSDDGYDSWYSDSGYDPYYSDSGFDPYYSDSGYDSWYSDSGYDSWYTDDGYTETEYLGREYAPYTETQYLGREYAAYSDPVRYYSSYGGYSWYPSYHSGGGSSRNASVSISDDDVNIDQDTNVFSASITNVDNSIRDSFNTNVNTNINTNVAAAATPVIPQPIVIAQPQPQIVRTPMVAESTVVTPSVRLTQIPYTGVNEAAYVLTLVAIALATAFLLFSNRSFSFVGTVSELFAKRTDSGVQPGQTLETYEQDEATEEQEEVGDSLGLTIDESGEPKLSFNRTA